MILLINLTTCHICLSSNGHLPNIIEIYKLDIPVDRYSLELKLIHVNSKPNLEIGKIYITSKQAKLPKIQHPLSKDTAILLITFKI